MEKTKLICIDIDSTLSYDHLTVPEENARAVRNAVRDGIHTVINSGRIAPSVRDFMNQIGLESPVPSLGGCLIEEWMGDIISEHTLRGDLAREIYDLASFMGCTLFAYRGNSWFLEKGNDDWADYEYRCSKVAATIVDFPMLLGVLSPNKLLGVSHDPERIKALMSAVNGKFSSSVDTFLSSPYYLDIVPRGVNKGTAVDRLCEYYSIGRENVMVIGDYYNDLDMFRAAGISVAVANAPDDVKAVTTYVTSRDSEHCAVAEAIERFALR